jgi:sporulation protein YlmC with PRC-barrel domain
MFTKSRMALLTILIVFAFALSACDVDGEIQDGTPAPETPVAENGEGIPATGEEEIATPEMDTPTPEDEVVVEVTPEVEATPEVDVAPTDEEGIERYYGQVPVTSGQQAPMSRAAEIMPVEARAEMMRLSNWMDFEVIDTAGNRIGTVHDYVLNMCEAHIIYVAIQTDNNDLVLMPYEVVTLGSGILDVEERAIVVSIAADEILGGPTIEVDADITDVAWETETRRFWGNYLTLSNLTTECLAAPTTAAQGQQDDAQDNDQDADQNDEQAGQAVDRIAVVRIDYASNMLEARIQDGNGQPIGVIEDVMLYPETGLLRYLVVNFDEDVQQGRGYVLIPFGAVNIETQEIGEQTVLVLLVERQILMTAPAYDQIPDTTQETWDAEAFEYWSQHVAMTQEDMP